MNRRMNGREEVRLELIAVARPISRSELATRLGMTDDSVGLHLRKLRKTGGALTDDAGATATWFSPGVTPPPIRSKRPRKPREERRKPGPATEPFKHVALGRVASVWELGAAA